MASTNNNCLIMLQDLTLKMDRLKRINPSNNRDAEDQRHQLVAEFVDESKEAIQEIKGTLQTCVEKLAEYEEKLDRFMAQYQKQSAKKMEDDKKCESPSPTVDLEEENECREGSNQSSDDDSSWVQLSLNSQETVREADKAGPASATLLNHPTKNSSSDMALTKSEKKKAKKQLQKAEQEKIDTFKMYRRLTKQSKRTLWRVKLSVYFRASGTEQCLEEMKRTKFSEVLEDAKWFHTTADYQEDFPDSSRKFVIDEIEGRYQDDDRNAFYGAILDLLEHQEFDLRADELVQFLMVKAKWFQRLLLRENNIRAELDALVNGKWKTSVTNYTSHRKVVDCKKSIPHYKDSPIFKQRIEYHKKPQNRTSQTGIWNAMYSFLETERIQNRHIDLDFDFLSRCTNQVDNMEKKFFLSLFDMKEYV